MVDIYQHRGRGTERWNVYCDGVLFAEDLTKGQARKRKHLIESMPIDKVVQNRVEADSDKKRELLLSLRKELNSLDGVIEELLNKLTNN